MAVDPSQLGQFSFPGIMPPTGGLYGAQQFGGATPGAGFIMPPSVGGGLYGGRLGASLPNLPTNFLPQSQVNNSPQIPQQEPQAPPQNPPPPVQPTQDNNDFLANVRQAGGGFLSTIGNIIDLPAKIIARPAFELFTEPQAILQAGIESGGDIFKEFNLINEKFEQNQLPGIVKAAGEMALDPLTYLSAGSLSAVSKAKYIQPILQATKIEPAVGAAIGGLQTYEHAVDAAFQGGSDLVRGIATNYIPLGVAKENARSVLTKILPDGLVQDILNKVPEEYRGIPINAITGPLNQANPKLGLPDVLGFPDVRMLKNAAAANTTWDAARNSLAQRGINPFAPGPSVNLRNTLRDIAYNPQSDEDIVVSSVLRNPGVISTTDVKRINTMVGGINTDPTISHANIFDSVVNSYHMQDIDQGTAVTALSQILGVGPKSNPEAGPLLAEYLNRRDDATTSLLKTLGTMEPNNALSEIAARARALTDKRFTNDIEAARMGDTYYDKFLNRFDTEYTMLWRNGVQRFITRPISEMYLGFTGYPIGNAIESVARSIVGGGGFNWPTDVTHFNLENGLVPNVPSELFKDESRQAYIAREMVARGKASPLDVVAEATAAPFIGFGSKLEQNIRRNYWNEALDQELDNVYFAKGLSGNQNFQDWFGATVAPNVANDPRFSGLDQRLADRINSMGIKATSTGQDAVDALKGSIDAGLFNREKLASQLADDQAFQDLHPTSRAIMTNWARGGEASQAAASDMIDRVMTNEKKLLEIAPDVLAEKFKGIANQIIARGSSPNFNTTDLWQNMTQMRAIKDQYADIPNMMRMAEYNGINENLIKGLDTQAVHDEFSQRISDSMAAVNKQIQIASTHLIGQADQLGMRPEMENYINALQKDHDLLAATWQQDAAFRQEFFAAKPNRKLDSTWNDPTIGYFPQRAAIWDNFGQQHIANRADIASAELAFQDSMVAKAQREAAANATLAQTITSTGASEVAPINAWEPNDFDLELGRKRALRENPNASEQDITREAMSFAKSRAMMHEAPTLAETGLQPGDQIYVKSRSGDWLPATVMGDLNTGRIHREGLPETTMLDARINLADAPTQLVSTADIRRGADQPSFREEWMARHVEEGVQQGKAPETISTGVDSDPHEITPTDVVDHTLAPKYNLNISDQLYTELHHLEVETFEAGVNDTPGRISFVNSMKSARGGKTGAPVISFDPEGLDYLVNKAIPNSIDILEDQWQTYTGTARGQIRRKLNQLNDLQSQASDALFEHETRLAQNAAPTASLQGTSDIDATTPSVPPTEPNVGPSDSGSIPENVGTVNDQPNNITGNGPSANAADPGTDFFTSKYAAVDSIRPRLEQILTQAFQNPAMTPEQQQFLIAHIDNMGKVFNGLSQDSQKVLNDSLREASQRAVDRYHKAYINYDNQTIFDFLAKHIFPFWVYESRRWPYLAQTALGKPGLAAAYSNYMDKTDQGYIPIGEIPYQINPLRGTILGGVNRATGADHPLRYTQGLPGALESIEATLGKFGLYLGPQFSIPSQLIRGEAGQALPEFFSSAVNAGRAMGLPGTPELQGLLPDPFRDYYVRQILASQNLEPNQVYQRAVEDPNSFESKALDAAQRQGSLVATILGQTGVLRYRTPEYSAYQDQRMQAVEKITGISVLQQRNMAANGVSINQVTSLTPSQRQELAAIPGAPEFAEVAEPLLNPAAQVLRQRQREFFDSVKTEREAQLAAQQDDDRRMQQGIISGTEWRKRFQDRSGKVSEMIDDLKKTDAYKNVPITTEEQSQARARFNLPPITLSPVDIVLQEYYNVKPQVDGVTGDVDWNQFFQGRQAVLDKYPEVAAAVKEQLDKHNTPQVQDFRNAQDILHNYFAIKDQILAANPQMAQIASQAQMLENSNPVQGALFRQNSMELKVLNQLISKYQQAARLQFPQIDAALVKYYGATPEQLTLMRRGSSNLLGGGGSIASAVATGKRA